jgi:hypothetical protein
VPPKVVQLVRHGAFPYAIALLTIVCIYALLNTKYRIFYVDDAWCLSYVHNFAFRGIDMDTLVRPPGHPRSILYLGKLNLFLMAEALGVLGWTKSSAHVVSSAFMFLTAGVWYAILRSIKFSFELAATAALGMLVFPAFFSSANLTRPDTLALFCGSLALLCFVRERYVLAGFFCVASVEVHIMGLTSGFYILSYTIYRRREFAARGARLFGQVALFLLGVAIGCGYYYALHYRYFELGTAFRAVTQHSAMSFPVKNYVAAYFFGKDWLQKLPELLFTIAMLLIFFRYLWGRAHPFVRTFLVVMLASTLVTTRPNGNYMLFLQPALVLMFVHSFELAGRLKPYAALAFGYWLLYYGVIWARHRDFEHQRVTDQIARVLTRSDLPVVGMMDNWFAAMDRTFYPVYPSAIPIPKRSFEEAYWIRNDYVRDRVGNYDATAKYMTENFELTELARVPAYDGHVAQVFLARRRN